MALEQSVLTAAHRVAAALGDEPAAIYVVGSAAVSEFEAGRSDLDMVAVFDRQLPRPEIEGVVERVLDVDVSPARVLELVVYAAGELVLNLNTRRAGSADDPRVEYGPREDEWFWFVIDRAIAEQHAYVLSGAPWRDVFPATSRENVLKALEAALHWHAMHRPRDRNTLLNALRARHYVETGEWISKREAQERLLTETLALVSGGRGGTPEASARPSPRRESF
ncbi:MAG: DUF4111 domain-containing protein [Actinomycetota bacterium]|nr:DUF4111 domain-containing protein [Actinomycetota bacterium]